MLGWERSKVKLVFVRSIKVLLGGVRLGLAELDYFGYNRFWFYRCTLKI
jgi:hypothetical protein